MALVDPNSLQKEISHQFEVATYLLSLIRYVMTTAHVHWILMEADLHSDDQKYPSLNTCCIVFKHCDIRLQCSDIKCVLNHANHASSHSKLGFMQFECGKCALNTLEKI